MSTAISVRLDDDALRALRQLEASGLTRSEAIRLAIVESAERRRWRSARAREVAELEADDVDRAEILEIARLAEELRAPG